MTEEPLPITATTTNCNSRHFFSTMGRNLGITRLRFIPCYVCGSRTLWRYYFDDDQFGRWYKKIIIKLFKLPKNKSTVQSYIIGLLWKPVLLNISKTYKSRKIIICTWKKYALLTESMTIVIALGGSRTVTWFYVCGPIWIHTLIN